MKIKIQQDGSFVSLSAVDHAARVTTITERLAANREELKKLKALVSPLKTISNLKLRLQQTPKAKAEPLRKKMADLREKHGLSPRTNYGPVSAKIKVLTAKIAKDKEALTSAKAKAKTKPKASAETKKTLNARGAKVTINLRKTGAKVIRDNANVEKLSNAKKKPAASMSKKDNVKASAIDNVKAKIKALKADIAAAKTVSKRQHLEKDLAAHRAQLRELRKGQTAKNRAAVLPHTKSKNMGVSKKAANSPADIKAQREKVSELRLKVAREKDATKKAALEKRYAAAVKKMKKMKLTK